MYARPIRLHNVSQDITYLYRAIFYTILIELDRMLKDTQQNFIGEVRLSIGLAEEELKTF